VDPDTGMFWRILQHYNMRHIFAIWFISLDNLIGSSSYRIIPQMHLRTRKSLLNFGSHPDLDSRVRIQTLDLHMVCVGGGLRSPIYLVIVPDAVV